MEYKRTLIKVRKARRLKNHKERGMVRLKIRGRKRWMKKPKRVATSE